jgi:hypothetical protein
MSKHISQSRLCRFLIAYTISHFTYPSITRLAHSNYQRPTMKSHLYLSALAALSHLGHALPTSYAQAVQHLHFKRHDVPNRTPLLSDGYHATKLELASVKRYDDVSLPDPTDQPQDDEHDVDRSNTDKSKLETATIKHIPMHPKPTIIPTGAWVPTKQRPPVGHVN